MEAKGLKMNTGKTKVRITFIFKPVGVGREIFLLPVVYERRESAIIQFCATAARNGSINDVVE